MGQDDDQETRQASSSVLTLDSVFDIKGPVRLVPQGAPQKPHIVLKRERLSQNAGESSCLARTTRFSFVANKRFTISKGHTLSLGIEDPTPDDEPKLLNSEGSIVLEFDIGNQIQTVDNISSLPARMRKSLTGTKTFEAFAERQGRNSLGFPGYPLSIPETRVFASASVQTDAVDPIEIFVSSSTRTPSPTPLKTKQKSPLRLYPSPVSVDDHTLDDARVGALAQSREDDLDIDARTERSFSSMDLSTPSQSFSNSPVIHSLSLPSTDVIPGPPDNDCFSVPPAAPEVMTAALQGLGRYVVSAAVKPDEIMETEPSRSVVPVPVPASTSQLKPKGTSQPIIDSSSTSLSQTATSPATNSIHDSGTSMDMTPTMPRAMSLRPGTSKAPQQTIKPNLSTPTPQSTISNPLGIRPSLLPKPVPIGPRSLFGTATPTAVQTRVVQATTPTLAPTGLVAPRKPVVVGAKWTALRGFSSSQANTNNAASAAAGSSSPVTSLTATSSTKTTTPVGISSNSYTSGAEFRKDLSQLLHYSASPSQGNPTSTTPSTGKRKLIEDNVLGDQGPLKRIRSENGEGDNMGEMKGLRIRGVAEALKKKVKVENAEAESLASTSAGLSQGTKGPDLLARVESTGASVDGGDSAVDGSAPVSKWKRKRERKRLSKKRKSELEQAEGVQEEDKAVEEAKERLKREEEEKMMKEKEIAKEQKGKLEKAAKLAQEKAEADNQKLAAAAAVPGPVLPAQTQAPLTAPPRVLHPLPPKPNIPITGSSYRPPGRKRGRSRTSSRSGDSLSRSRSRSQGRETTQARRFQSPSRSRSRNRDPSVDRQPQDKQAKPSAPAINSSIVTQSKQEEHTPNEARVPRMAPVPTQVRAVINGNTTWPTTSPNREIQILGREGGRTAVQQIMFSSDGKRLAIITNDMSVRMWETYPRVRELRRCQVHTYIVAICWLQYDVGVLLLCSDGSTDVWGPEEKTLMWQRKTLFNVPFSVQSEKLLSLAYGKDKIAISTTVSVKVWLLTSKGVWQPQREIKRSGVTALRFKTDGSGLFGGCRDGTLWYSEVPNGTLRAYAFLPSNKCITSIQLHPNGTQLLIGQKGGTAYLISHQLNENKGTLEKKYIAKTDDETEGAFAAIFATGGQAVVSGVSNGCVLVWDRKKGNMVYGLKHGTDDGILAIAAYDGRPGMDGLMVSGTREGKLCWWPIPKAAIR